MADSVSLSHDCIFCKIIRKEIPAQKLYEDAHTLAILDINPISPGHTLLLSKAHNETTLDTPPEVFAALTRASYPVISAILAGTKAEGYNILINNHKCAGQLIPHLHWHIIPRHSNDNIHFHWHPTTYQKGEMEKIAEAIRKHINA